MAKITISRLKHAKTYIILTIDPMGEDHDPKSPLSEPTAFLASRSSLRLSAAVSNRWKSRKTGAGGAGEPPGDVAKWRSSEGLPQRINGENSGSSKRELVFLVGGFNPQPI